MELFGIAFAVPLAAVASGAYAYVLGEWDLGGGPLLLAIRLLSGTVLLLIAAELALLAALGAVDARAAVGPDFYGIHLGLFVLGVPALANLLVLGWADAAERWRLVPIPSAIVALILLLMQYQVSEALYGIDGVSGPYAR